MRDLRPFWDKVKKGAPHECWPWTGYVRASGHGLTQHEYVMMNASRKAWILTHGRIVGDLCVNHICDNPLCCNPAHMYLGTRADNMIDYWQNTPPDERMARGRNSVLNDEQLEELWKMRQGGATLKQCAERFTCHLATICRYITAKRRAKLQKNRQDRMAGAAR